MAGPDAKTKNMLNKIFPPLMRDFYERLPYGVIITDPLGHIVYYNQSQSLIDSLGPEEVLGKKTSEVYGPHYEPSLTMACLQSRQPIIDFVALYRTCKGKIISSSHTIFPILEGGELLGAVCLIVEMKRLVAANKVSTGKSRPKVVDDISFDTLIGNNLKFKRAIELGRLSALSPSPVMLAAETGCGKEMFARSIHRASDRSNKSFLAVNCAAIPEQLLEGLLFGTVKGAFTGATDRSGLFEQADGGTLFLDELDSMPLELQPKLLRVIQERSARRIGGEKDIFFDLKIISSISGGSDKILASGRIRSDLFYRLGVVIIDLPPLRERLDDLPLLTEYFLMKHNIILGRIVGQADSEVLSSFLSYDWPGNIRELEHIIEGALNLATDGDTLTVKMLPDHFHLKQSSSAQQLTPLQTQEKFTDNYSQTSPDLIYSGSVSSHGNNFPANLQDAEKQAIINALRFTGGNVTSAAKLLGLSRQLLTYKIKKHSLNRTVFKI